MADIKQAAKWMMEGKPVHRKLCPAFVFYQEVLPEDMKAMQAYVLRKERNQVKAAFQLGDLLADDWEIAE